MKYFDLESAYEFVSCNSPSANSAYIERGTERIYYHSDYGDNIEELPDDIDDGEKYIAVPHKNDLDLGRELVYDFVSEYLPEEYDQVRDIFSHRGAYSRFKDFLEYHDMLKVWHNTKISERRMLSASGAKTTIFRWKIERFFSAVKKPVTKVFRE